MLLHATRWFLAGLATLVALALFGSDTPGLAGVPAGPAVNEPIVATFQAGELTLTGSGFGKPPAVRAVIFSYTQGTTTVDADSPFVSTWSDKQIVLTLPPNVQSGQFAVTVDGVASAPGDLLVFGLESIAIPPSAGTNKHPLALAIGADGTLWINHEFHLELKSLSPDPASTQEVEYRARGTTSKRAWHLREYDFLDKDAHERPWRGHRNRQ